MVNKDAFQRYLDAGIAFTTMTRARAEELVQELVQSGEFQSGDARAKVDELIERTRKSREALVSQVRREVVTQLDSMGITSVEELAKQVALLLSKTADAGKAATATAKKSAGKKTAKKAPAKKAAAKKAAAKKSAGKKAAAKKAVSKKAVAKKSVAKKSVAKKAPAKKSAKSAGTGSEG